MSELTTLIIVGVINAVFLLVLGWKLLKIEKATNGLVEKLEAGAHREGVTEGRAQMESQ